MAKAARQLAMTQPSVSAAIANLEHVLGARLLDRGPRGIEPTIFAEALLKRSVAVFDELKQSVRDIEFLADPTVGELRIGCPESLLSALLQPIIRKFNREYPNVTWHIQDENAPTLEIPALRARNLDLAFVRLVRPPTGDPFAEDLNIETLFDDDLAVAVGMESKWARQRKIDLDDLLDEPWILTAPGTWTYSTVAQAFQACGHKMPELYLTTFSVHLRANLLADGTYVTAFARSFLKFNANRFSLKALPLMLPTRPWPVTVVTLKSRTLSPVVERFIKCAHEIAKELAPAR
jgi:DNA-binding transcriptional LysR family regulator